MIFQHPEMKNVCYEEKGKSLNFKTIFDRLNYLSCK